MTFFRYIVACFLNVILLGNGMSDIAKPNIKTNLIGIATLVILSTIFCLFGLVVYKRKKMRILYAALSTIVVVLIFFVICVAIELMIK